jgi:hypothetical protein
MHKVSFLYIYFLINISNYLYDYLVRESFKIKRNDTYRRHIGSY